MTKTQQIIEKWYQKLEFPKKYDEEFYQILEEIPVPEELRIEDTDPWSPYGKENLVQHLYFVEQLREKYEANGLPESVLLDTMKDIVNWTNTWSDVRGELWLEETHWLRLHFNLQLFCLGRLHYYKGIMWADQPDMGLKQGEGFLDVHIPAEGPLEYEKCVESFHLANEFFAKYYPDFSYENFYCDSWLLDESLKKYLKPESNILKFQTLFTPVRKRPENDILHCIFHKDTNEENLADAVPTSSFAKKIKEDALKGVQFYSVM